MFKVYKIEGSPTVRAVLMTAEALNVDYETHSVDFMGGEHKTPEYLEKNPAHTVPIIEEDGFFLADSHAIITYLADKYGDEESKLYPKDLKTRAIVNQRLFFEATVLNSASTSVSYGVVREGQTGPTPHQIEDVNECYEILDKYLQKTKFVACDHLTVADFSCIAAVTFMDFWVPVDEKYTKVKAWMKGLEKEDWYQRGLIPGLTLFKEYMTNIKKKRKASNV
ncbi:hypothetical protein PYW08_005846 [Mythimna loreyi]|uniref:Uncharacterized protein n=1 Tax=Mythimna loreyi TaxID=667449 RepID=A0ACC2QKF5_9NEOP|nr:hypothetical protein PYW08_005846 [Mythimna loreyi]